MQTKGRILQVCDPVTNNGFTKQLFVVETTEQYNNKYPFEFDPAKLQLTKLNEGDSITVDWNVRGNQSKTDKQKWFTSLQAWKINIESNMPQ
jgi:hypothetical protein